MEPIQAQVTASPIFETKNPMTFQLAPKNPRNHTGGIRRHMQGCDAGLQMHTPATEDQADLTYHIIESIYPFLLLTYIIFVGPEGRYSA